MANLRSLTHGEGVVPSCVVLRVANLLPSDTNSVFVSYYQAPRANTLASPSASVDAAHDRQHRAHTVRECVLNELLVKLLDEPCFNTLRTNQKLGYTCYALHHSKNGDLGSPLSSTLTASLSILQNFAFLYLYIQYYIFD